MVSLDIVRVDSRITQERQTGTLVFSIFLYGAEYCSMKDWNRKRIDVFEMYWQELLRITWIARGTNVSTLSELDFLPAS